MADMVARAVALSILRPGQPNRAMDILRAKLWRDASGQVEERGLTLLLGKTKGHREVPVAQRRTGSPIPKPTF